MQNDLVAPSDDEIQADLRHKQEEANRLQRQKDRDEQTERLFLSGTQYIPPEAAIRLQESAKMREFLKRWNKKQRKKKEKKRVEAKTASPAKRQQTDAERLPFYPYGPVAGQLLEIDSAESDKLSHSQVVETVLDTYRHHPDSDRRAEAKRDLVTGYRYLIYEKSRTKSGGISYDSWASMWAGLCTAIRRLESNTVGYDGIEKYLKDEIARSRYDQYWEEKCGVIRAPASTNSDRKARGEEPYAPLFQEQDWNESGDNNDSTGESGDGQTVNPVAYLSDNKQAQETEMARLIEAVTITPLERTILGMKIGGFTQAEIANTLGITIYQVQQQLRNIEIRTEERCPELVKSRRLKLFDPAAA